MAVKIVVDISGGLVNAVHATEEVEIVFVDYEEDEKENAKLPPDEDGFELHVWAEKVIPQIDPKFVNEFISGIEWLPDEGEEDG